MAGNVYKGLTIELNAKTTALSSALRQSEREARTLQKEMKQVQKAIDFDPSSASAFSRQMKLLEQSVESASEKLGRLREAESKYGEQGMSADAWTKLQYEIEKTEADIERFRAQMKRLAVEQAASESSLGRAGAKLEELGEKLSPIGERMQSIGRGMTTHVTLPIAAAATASIKAATDIDTALTGVRKTVDGTEGEYRRLKEAAVEFSKVNAVSAAQVLDAQALGAQLGFAIDELDQFARVATGLDIATNMQLEDAATEMAQFANITRMAHGDIDRYASAIVNLGNNMATTESDISALAQRVAAAGTQVRMTQAEILGWSGAMASLGIEAETGGTAFSQFVSAIDAAVARGGEKLESYAALAGMSADEFSRAWAESSTSAVQGILRGLAASENMTLALSEMGVEGVRQSDVLKRLAGNVDLVAQGLDHANAGWSENAALSAEVANRNDSMAAKFEMLKNRLVAVADDVGAPLVDALMDTVDAAEPLFAAIESGARAFSEMGEGEQRTVVATVALVAALGPMMSVAGKLMGDVKVAGGAMQALARGLAGIDVATGGAKDGLRKVADASGKATTEVKKASVAMGALKGAAATAAVAGIALLASAVGDYMRGQGELVKATSGASDALRALDADASAVSAEMRAASSAFDRSPVRGYAAEVDALVSKQAELNSQMRESFSDVAGRNGALGIYAGKIAELAGNCGGSAAKLAELKAAVDGYNSVAGTSYRVTDEVTGALDASTASIANNAEAWKRNAESQAIQSALTDVYEQRIPLERELADLESAHAAAERELQETMSRGEPVSQSQLSQAAALEEQLDKTRRMLDANVKSEDDLIERKSESDAAYRLATATVDDYRSALEASGGALDDFDAAAERAGEPVEEFAERLKAARISAGDFAKAGAEEFARLRDEASGDLSKVKSALEAVDAFGFDVKDLHVTDNGEIADAEGRVIDLDRRVIGDKSFRVEAVDHASSVLDRIRGKLAELSDEQQVKVTASATAIASFFRRAAGGVSLSGVRVPKHADGGISGIVTQPTLTNVGLVGEAGAEAIVPLTNRRYVGRFAQAVASEIPDSRYDDSALMDELRALHRDIARLEVVIDREKVGAAVAPSVDRALGGVADRKGI